MKSVVIGAGFGGIAAALRLRAKKHEVTIIEKHNDLLNSKLLVNQTKLWLDEGKYNEVTKIFNLNVEIIKRDIFQEKNLVSDIIVARAFKPLPVILELVDSNFKIFNEIILFLGKNGKELLDEALSKWQFEYKKKKSLTSENSFVLKISNLRKKK